MHDRRVTVDDARMALDDVCVRGSISGPKRASRPGTLAKRSNSGGPGPGVVLVGVFDTRRPALAPVSEVQVAILGPSGRGEPQRAEQLSNGKWSLATRLDESGPVQVKVLVRRVGLPDATRSFSWVIGGGQIHTRAALVSTAPIRGLLETAAAILLFIALSAALLWMMVPRLRRRRRASQSPAAVPQEVQIPDVEVRHLSAR